MRGHIICFYVELTNSLLSRALLIIPNPVVNPFAEQLRDYANIYPAYDKPEIIV